MAKLATWIKWLTPPPDPLDPSLPHPQPVFISLMAGREAGRVAPAVRGVCVHESLRVTRASEETGLPESRWVKGHQDRCISPPLNVMRWASPVGTSCHVIQPEALQLMTPYNDKDVLFFLLAKLVSL